nr:hypothetical protein [Tanacetum cinerariifolium]
MSRDVIKVGSTMRIPLLYRGEYLQWRERFMNYLKEQTDGEAMINSIQNGDQPLLVIAQVSLAGTAQNAPPTLKPKMRGSEYGEQDRKAAILYEYETFKAIKGEQLLDTYLCYLQVINDLKKCGYKNDNCELNYKFLNNLQQEWKHYATLMRQTKNLVDINIDALYNILKQNQEDVNDALGYKKKAVVVHSDPLALVVEKTNPANKKQEFVKTDDKKVEKKANEKKRDMSKVKCYNCKKERHFAKDCKKANVKDYNYYKTKMLLAKKDSDEQVLLVEDQAWMESSSDSDQEINANMVFMAQIEKVLSESEESPSFAEENIAEVAYYTSGSESESEFETLEYYVNSTNYGLFVNNDDDQEIFHDAIESASENFIENHNDSQKDYDKSEVDHNDSEEKEHLVDNKDFKNQNKDLQEKYDVLINQVNTFEEKNNEFNDQIKVLNEKNADLLAQTKVLKDQLQVKHVVIDTHVECHEKHAKLEEEIYEYMIKYSTLFDNDKQHRKQIADQEVLFDKMSVELVELNKHVRYLKNTVLEKDFKISELEECMRNKDLEIEKCLKCWNDYENKLHKMGQTNQNAHMIMPSKDNLYNCRKVLNEKNADLLDQTKVLKDQLQVKHVVIDTHVECHEKHAKLEAERYEYMIRYSALFDNDKQHRKQIADQKVMFDKMSVELVELDKHVRDLKNIVLEKDFKISELEECVRNKDLEIEKCSERLNDCENKLHKMGQTNQTVHMIMPSKDNMYNGRKRIGFENLSYFENAKDLRPTLYDEKVIGLGYTLMFLTHSNEALEIEKFNRSRENKIEFAYDYENLNASYVNEKINFEDDYFQEIINPDFENINSPFQQTSSLKPYVLNVILEKIIIDLKDEVVSLLKKEKANLERF